MIKGKRKLNTMLLALCMVLTAFVAVASLPVGADQVSIGGTFEIYWWDSWMEDDPAEPSGANEDIEYNYDDVGNSLYYLGDESARIEFRIRNDEANDIWDVYITLTSLDLSIVPTVPDDRWPASGDYGNDLPGERFLGGSPGDWIDDDPTWGGLNNEPWFTIDIANTGNANSLYVNALQIEIDYVDSGGPDSDTFVFDLYVSSVFDADNSDFQRDEHDDLPDIDETDADDEFEAGVTMQEGQFFEDNWAGFDISDVEGTISSLPAGITMSGGANTAINPGPINANGGNLFLYWRFDVASNVLPGTYSMNLAFQYVRDDTGETINENARSTELTVDFAQRLTARLVSPVTIMQNDLEATMSVIFTNEGNVDLNDVVIRPDPDGTWMDVRFHHYENDDDVYETEVMIGDLAIGADSAPQTVMVATNMMLPNGSHRLPFAWSSWVFEDGSTGGASRWVMMGGEMYNHDFNTQTPEVERFYQDNNEDGRYGGGDTVLEAMWDGAYVDFEVDDDNGLSWKAIIWSTVNAGVGGDVRFRTIRVDIDNFEMVRYKDIVAVLTVGSDTPFLAPADHSATTLDMDPNSDTIINAAVPGNPGDAEIYFTVDVNAAWWQDDSFAPETYEIDLTVSATSDDDEERIVDEPLTATVNIDGFGPELFASLVSYTKITPGETFTLTVTVTNHGDDIAREVDAYLRADFVSGWRILDEFTAALGSSGRNEYMSTGDVPSGDYVTTSSSWNKTNKNSMEDVGVDSVSQIVELHDWIQRRETPPQGIVLWMHRDRLEPGDTWSIEFEMISDVHMVEGMVYYEVVELFYVDSNGDTYGPNTVDYDEYTPPQEVLVRTGKGEKFDPSAADFGWMLYMLIFVIIAFIIFLIGFAMGGRGGKDRSRPEPAPFEDYEQDYSPPPEDDMGPPEPEEDMIPPPAPEENKPPE
jgi:hypothetical protein